MLNNTNMFLKKEESNKNLKNHKWIEIRTTFVPTWLLKNFLDTSDLCSPLWRNATLYKQKWDFRSISCRTYTSTTL